jgi:hypothetical protein
MAVINDRRGCRRREGTSHRRRYRQHQDYPTPHTAPRLPEIGRPTVRASQVLAVNEMTT